MGVLGVLFGALTLALVMSGCASSRLQEVRVANLERAGESARSRAAYARASARSREIEVGMSKAAVEGAMGGVIAAEGEVEDGVRRETLIEGRLCTAMPTELQERWIFGYDEGGVVLIGFAIEFEREDVEDDGWVVRGVDRSPRDDCPDVGS